MSKIHFAALCAGLAMALPATAQDPTPPMDQATPPSTEQEDKAKAEKQAQEIMGDRDIHWTLKERMELLMNAPFMRPREQWELLHLFRMLPSNEERVLQEALTNALRATGSDYMRLRAWLDLPYAQRITTPAPVITRTETVTTIQRPGEPTVVREQETVTVQPGVRTQQIGAAMALGEGLSAMEAYELLERDLDAEDRTMFRTIWNDLDSWQRDAFISTVQHAARYYNYRISRGY